MAICRPNIRSKAEEGDFIFGFAAKSLNPDNPLIYAALVTSKLAGGEYHKERRYAGREDRIYQFNDGRYIRRKEAQHHFIAGDLVHDLGPGPNFRRISVLLSRDFRYFRKENSCEYKAKFR